MIAPTKREGIKARLHRWAAALEQGWGRVIADETMRVRGERALQESTQAGQWPVRKPGTTRPD